LYPSGPIRDWMRDVPGSSNGSTLRRRWREHAAAGHCEALLVRLAPRCGRIGRRPLTTIDSGLIAAALPVCGRASIHAGKDRASRNRAPIATVGRLSAIVAKQEVVVVRHRHLTRKAAVGPGLTALGEIRKWLVEPVTISGQAAASQAQSIAG